MAKFTDRDRYGMYRTLDQDGPGPALMGAHTLLGNDVVNGQDESLGDIKEIMLDMRAGRVAYAVLAFGGFLGIGEKLFAVPWQALTLDTGQHRFVAAVHAMQAGDRCDLDHPLVGGKGIAPANPHLDRVIAKQKHQIRTGQQG